MSTEQNYVTLYSNLCDNWDLIVSNCETVNDVKKAVFKYLGISKQND